mgnify:CR=1 FL=1
MTSSVASSQFHVDFIQSDVILSVDSSGFHARRPKAYLVGLGKVMSSPIARTTDIAYSCHAKHTRRECLSGDNIRHSTSLSVTICIEIEESFPPHGQQIHQANRTPQVLLRNLEFRNKGVWRMAPNNG